MRSFLAPACVVIAVVVHHLEITVVSADEHSQVNSIRAGRQTKGLDPEFVAAVRRIDERGGELKFDSVGNLIAVDLATDRVSVTDADLPSLRALPHLAELRLSGGGVSNEGLRVISSITGLVELSLLDATIDDRGVEQLVRLLNLHSLTIRRSPMLTDKAIASVARLPKLKNLGLLNLNITDQAVEQIARITGLALLDLRGCAQIDNQGLSRLASLRHLKVLRLSGQPINDDSLTVIKSPALMSLTVEEAAITDVGLGRLGGTALEELNISRCYSVTDDGLRQLKSLAALRQFSLRGVPVTGEGLSGLANLNSLKLNETGVGDDAVRQFAAFKNLARLELRQTMVSDASVEHLLKLARLRTLDIRETGISEAAARRLVDGLPGCKVLR